MAHIYAIWASPKNAPLQQKHHLMSTSNDPPEKDSLEKLKNWIDNPPDVEQSPYTQPPFLYNPGFTDAVLKEGFIYAVDTHKALHSDYVRIAVLTRIQYFDDFDPFQWLDYFGLTSIYQVERVCMLHEMNQPNYAELIRQADFNDERSFGDIRRTIVALARVNGRMREANGELARWIGRQQGDIE